MSAWGTNGSAKSCDALLARVEANDPTLVELVILPIKTFGAAQVERLAAALTGTNTHLTSLSASGHVLPPNSLARLGSAIALQKCNLVQLAIGHQGMGDEGVVAFCGELEDCSGGRLQVVDLAWKDLSTKAMAALGRTFGPSHNLRSLNLSRNERVRDEGIMAFCTSAIARCEKLDRTAFSTLQEFDLSECGIGATGVQSLVDMLRTTAHDANSSPKSLSLTLNANELGPEACSSLALLLCETSILTSLSLVNCNIGNEGVAILSKAVSDGTCLELLDLSHNGIEAEGAVALGESLWNDGTTSWPKLVELRLAGNNLSGEGVKSIMDALAGTSEDTTVLDGNQILQSLDLTQTNCGVDGAVAAVHCSSLVSLRLFKNKLGSDGFQALANELQGGHPSLVNLDLGGNDADEASVVKLLTALSVDKKGLVSALRVLEIGGNEGGNDVEAAIANLKELHPELDVARDRPKKQEDA